MWRRWWRRQAETPATPAAPPPTDEELIERIAREIVDRRLAAPALFVLESSRPLSFVASQGLVVLGPFVDAALDIPDYEAFCDLIEKRENVDKLAARIEELEDARLSRRPPKKEPPPPADEPAAHGPQAD